MYHLYHEKLAIIKIIKEQTPLEEIGGEITELFLGKAKATENKAQQS